MDVVVVESPAKAKTINKYLGSGYKVLASYGHVRDLPARDGSVRPDADFSLSWEVDPKAEKHLREIAAALKGADHLYLATDPDREGEAISWHVREVLAARKALDGVDVKRVAFNEITRDAVLEALAHPRELNDELIQAYLARRALDYLVGFTLSPVLWRKLPGAKSAGRVQSVALRLICEREAEIEVFRPREYWSVDGAFTTAGGAAFAARLTHLNGRKLDKFDLADKDAAARAVATVEAGAYRIATVEKSKAKRHPQPPFTTSTLQQEAARKLGFSATRTMRTAQRLYEGVDIGGETVGLITYMRTDSTQMANEAVAGARALIAETYGGPYLPDQPRVYRRKAKNAQEAHEAVRPTDMRRRPDRLGGRLDDDQRRLYELVWKRAVASQMESALFDRMAVDIASADGAAVLRATGQAVAFDGFLRLYEEGRDDPGEGENGGILPPLAEGETPTLTKATSEQHFTQPPPRYSEASLVKKLEELGIGRPSTYASILDVLRRRDYVRMDNRRFVPEDRGRLVTAFLTAFFERYVEYDFTAQLEDGLDDISDGRMPWKRLLRDFWSAFGTAVDGTKDLTISQVIDALDEALGPHFFPVDASGADPRRCTECGTGRLGLRLGRHGAFIGCSNYPDCKHTRSLEVPVEGRPAAAGPRELGTHPDTGEPVSLRKGPYGLYVQLGEESEGATRKPKRASLAKGVDPATVDLDTALKLLALPREVGPHPGDGEPIVAGIGPFGPYLRHQSRYVSLRGDDDVLTIGINRAVILVDQAHEKARASLLHEVGAHPKDGKPITVNKGRFGPYIKHGRVFCPLPKDRTPESIGVDEAVALLAAKSAKGKGKGKGKKAPRRKAAAKKAPAKKAPAKKKKAPAKKAPASRA